MKNILITNDDGVGTVGLNTIIEVLKPIAKILVVVPDRGRSSISHAITLSDSLRVYQKGKNFYITNGTPVDCVRLGLLHLSKQKIDLVVSGINQSANLGEDIIYSGTVAAAREGIMNSIPSVALSLAWRGKGNGNFNTAAAYGKKIVNWILKNNGTRKLFLNVNVPDVPLKSVKGIEITRMGRRIYDPTIDVRKDPRGWEYYWLGGKFISGHKDSGTDIDAIFKNKVSLTPLKFDTTDYDVLSHLKETLII